MGKRLVEKYLHQPYQLILNNHTIAFEGQFIRNI